MKRLAMHQGLRWVCLFSAMGLLIVIMAARVVSVRAQDTPKPDTAVGQIQDDSQAESPKADDSFSEEARPVGVLRKLTKEEINRVRYMELRGMRVKVNNTSPDVPVRIGPPDRVSVRIPKETIDDFLVEMEGHELFRGERNRRWFRRMTAPQKLHVISHFKGSKYADRVEIRSDPEVFVTYKKQVFPIVMRSCATNGCHGYGTSRRPFVLFNDPKRSVSTTYSDFVALATFEHNGHYVIDRAHPEDSLLLTYMLPRKDVKPELRHPGNIEIKPGFRTRSVIEYRRIEEWISSLKHPAEDYGVNVWSDEPEQKPDAGSQEDKPADKSDEPQEK